MKNLSIKKGISYKDIQNFMDMYETIYVYGAGKYAEILLNQIFKNFGQIKAVVVSDKGNNADKIMGIPILSLDEIIEDNNHTGFILGVSNNYDKEIIKTLYIHGYTNILCMEDMKVLEGNIGWQTLAKMPKLEITPKIGCNIQCRYCPQQLLYKTYFKDNKSRRSIMDFEDYKKCINKTPKNTIITFSGFVEPFHHPKAIDMIQYAHASGRHIELYTTFVGVTETMLEQIKDIPFIQVVLHTPDCDGYANIPMTDEYFKVIDKVLDYKKANGKSFVDSANCQSKPAEAFLEIARGRIEIKSALVDRAGNLEGNGLKKSRGKAGKIYCRRSLKQNHWVLLPDGSVVLCCMDFGLRHVLGNLIKSEYEEIIQGEEYLNIRKKMMIDDDFNLLCRDCTSAGLMENL